jgi:hypothetical protein
LFAADPAALGVGAALVWAKAGKADSAQASRIEGKSLCDTKAPLNMCTAAKPESVSAVAHASCRIAPFRRYRVSEVCRGGGFLLVFAASRGPFWSGCMVPERAH